MPSAAYLHWKNDRMARVAGVEGQCVAVIATVPPPDVRLVEELMRGLVIQLCGHFQGFCRDLYSEAAQSCAAQFPIPTGAFVLTQFNAGLQIDRANPTLETLAVDYKRFGIDIRSHIMAMPGGQLHIQNLARLNKWRNHIAHQTLGVPAGLPLDLATLRSWVNLCDSIGVVLDGVVYNFLSSAFGQPPW